jgi:hypothetical protein
MASHHRASYSCATSVSVRPSARARVMMLSSTSVMLDTYRTVRPLKSS